MNIERATQIIESPDKITVTYQGVPVWIQTIDDHTQMAKVHTENNPDHIQTIPIHDLKEIG